MAAARAMSATPAMMAAGTAVPAKCPACCSSRLAAKGAKMLVLLRSAMSAAARLPCSAGGVAVVICVDCSVEKTAAAAVWGMHSR